MLIKVDIIIIAATNGNLWKSRKRRDLLLAWRPGTIETPIAAERRLSCNRQSLLKEIGVAVRSYLAHLILI